LHRDFQRVLKTGRRLVHPALFIYVYSRSEGTPLRRLGLVTSRKVGGAVQRNRVKRLLREIFRLHKHEVAPATDIIFMPKAPAVRLDFRQLSEIVLSALREAGVLK
jgi:ribonuclease P protein component